MVFEELKYPLLKLLYTNKNDNIIINMILFL